MRGNSSNEREKVTAEATDNCGRNIITEAWSDYQPTTNPDNGT